MKFRQFSNIGWRVSEIGLGCWAIGSEWGDVSHEDATEVLKTSLDNGINFFDTADVYGDGRSEQFRRGTFKIDFRKNFAMSLQNLVEG